MGSFLFLSVLVLASIFGTGVSQSCQKSSYLPEGVACNLDIYIRSEGQIDTNLSVALGSSFLIVNGRDYSSKSSGINVAVFDDATGAFVSGGVFDVKASNGDSLRDFIQDLPNKVIIVMAIQTSGNLNTQLSSANAALTSIGVNNTAIADQESFAAVLCKGAVANCEVKQSKNAKGNGPSFISLSIKLSYTYIPDESLRSPFFDVARQSFGGVCSKASSNPSDCYKALDGLTTTEWVSSSEGVGAWVQIEFPSVKINKARIFQRSLTTAQIKDVRMEFSDCTTVHVALTKDKNSFEEFWFTARVAIWVKLTVTSTHSSSNPVGYKAIQLVYDEYKTDTICDQAIVNTGETSSAYPLLTNTMSLRIKSQDAIIILSTTSSATGPRYEIVFDQASSNTTFLRRSQDGSSIKTVATSTKRPRYVTSTVKIHVWLDWTPGRVVVGMGDRIILYYVDASALNAKYLFLKSPSSNGVFDICGRPDYLFRDANHFWPFDKVILNDFKSSNKGTLQGPFTIAPVTGNFAKFSNLAVKFDGTSNSADLGDFKDDCISDPDLCGNGLTVLLRFKREGSGNRYIMSSNGENGRGFAISHTDTTGLVTVVLRDTNRRWEVNVQASESGQQMLGFSWSPSNGLEVVVGFASLTVKSDINGQPMTSSADSSTRLIIGKPSLENAKYFQGMIDSITVYYEHKETEWIKNFMKGTVLSGFTSSCNQYNALTAPQFYYPALDHATMSPNQCQEGCKAHDKALIDDGGICKCITNAVSLTGIGNELCSVPCTGNRQLKCGGFRNAGLVLPAVSATASLTCTIPSMQPTFTKFDAQFQASKTFYEASSFLISSGEGFVSTSHRASFPFQFINVQNYTTTPEVQFKNNETGEYVTVPCPNSVTSYMATTELKLSCPPCAGVNSEFQCNITYTQSQDDVLTLVTDGASQSVGLPGSKLIPIGSSCFTRNSESSTSGMYILPYHVNGDGTVVALDIDVIKEGYLEIKCLSVQCDQSSRYCPLQKSCIAKSTACEGKTTCASELFMGTGRCSQSGCASDLPEQKAANLDYKSQYSLVIWANAGHKRLITMNKTVDASSCDFFGVHVPESNPAKLSLSSCTKCSLFYSLNAVKAANSSNSTFPGFKSPVDANGPSLHNYVPNVRVNILRQGSQSITMKYTSDGLKPIKIISQQGTSSYAEVRLQHILSNLTFSASQAAYPVGKLSNITLMSHLYTNATYQWKFNDANITTNVPWTMYSCPKSGLNSITMFGSNCMSLSYAICEILCQEEIDGLEFAKNGLETTAENKGASINWLLRNGSHVNITVDCGDGSALKYLVNSKVAGAVLVASVNKTYTTKGVYTVNVTACNLIGCKSLVGNLTIQSSVANLTFNSPACTATNHSGNFTSGITDGCEVKYSWTTENKTSNTDSQNWFTYIYNKAGLHSMSVTAYNNVSTALVTCKDILIKDTIEGVEVGPVADSGIPQIAVIPYKVGGGSDVKASICYGDGVCENQSGNFSAEGAVVYSGSFSHNYTKGGDYVANLTFCNCVGCNSTTVDVHVEIPVSGQTMIVTRKSSPTIIVDACSTPLYVLVDELVYMASDIANGTNVKITWDYGDGTDAKDYMEGEFHQSGARANHSYTKSGNYTITVTLDNKNGHKEFKCAIVAQDPILALEMTSNSPQGIPDGSLTITTTTSGARPSDPIHCVMNFGDGKSTSSLAMSYGTPQSIVNKNNYPHVGFFKAEINCSNAVSSVAKWISVELQDKIYGSSLVAIGMAPQAKRYWVEGDGYNGSGIVGTIYPLEYDIMFNAQSFNGTNKTCSYCFDCAGAQQDIRNSTCGNMTHKFTTTGVKNVKVTTKNDVSVQIVQISVTIEESISCGEIPDPGPEMKTVPHIFKPALTKQGPNWCCVFKYGDTAKADYYIPSSSKCTALPSIEGVASAINDPKYFEGSSFIVNHTFPGVGEYSNILYCWNRVSECQTPIKAVVVLKPCKQPIVTVPDLSVNKTQATSSMKSVTKVIRSKNIVDCEASLVRDFKWEFAQVDTKTNVETKINLTDRVPTTDEFVTLKPLTLGYGLYKVCFTLNLTEMVGVEGTVCSYLSIIKSPLIPELSGGSLVAVGYNKSKTLDGTASRDPDTSLKVDQDTDLTCYFFCKAVNENYKFPEKFDANNVPPVPAVRIIPVNNTGNVTYLGGCYGDGPGRLKSTAKQCSLGIFTGNMLENTTYTFRMYMLHKDGRFGHTEQKWQIKQGDPPVMAIKCYDNCNAKLNPSGKTSLSCVCVDCSASVSVFYQWSICKLTPGSDECVTLDQDTIDSYIATPLDGRNLAIYPNKLKGGSMYQFKCFGWRGKKSGSFGQSVLDRTVNRMPRQGTCNVSPPTGIALNTTFTITCENWFDNDKPLTYTFGTVTTCADKKDPKILASDRLEKSYKVESLLPGKKENNYTLYITVHVSDTFKAINTSVCIPVQVIEKKLELKALKNMLNGDVNRLIASGSNNEVNQVLSGIASQLNVQSTDESKPVEEGGTPAPTKSPKELQDEKDERMKLRASVVETLNKVKPTSIADAVQTAQTLNAVLDCKPDEVTEEAKEAAVNVLSAMTDTISTKAGEGAESTEVIGALNSVFASVQKSMAMLSDTDSQQAEQPTFSTENKATEETPINEKPTAMSAEKKNQKRKLADSLTKVLDTVATLALKTLRAGEKPTTIQTTGMEMQVSRESVQDLMNKTTVLNGGLSFQTPTSLVGEDNGGGDEPPAVDSKSLLSADNIYNYGSNTFLTSGGKLATIEYLNTSGGEPIKVENLTTPMEIFVPRQNSPLAPVVREMDKEQLYSHRVEIQHNDTALHIIVYPDNCNYGFTVYIKKNSFPKEDNSDFNYSLPHDNRWDLDTNCSYKDSNDSKAYEIFMPSKVFNHTAAGMYFISIKPKARNGSGVVEYLPANYTTIIYTSMCLYWDKRNETWSTEGTEVSSKTTPEVTACLSNHLTSFTSSCIVPPNTIDWDKIANVTLDDVYVVMSAVLTVYCLYLICLILARRADKRDAEKTGVCPLPDNDPRDNYCYEIHVHTGFARGAGTSAEVSIVMNGSVGDSDPRVLKDSVRKTFRTGGVDAFLMTAPQSLGTLRNIRLWHNNAGAFPSWNLLRIMIQDLQTEERWWFVCDAWLAVDEGDFKIERTLYPATSNELTKFNVLFATEIRKNLTDGHLWFSVVTRPARSTFTRVQRLTCCLSILLTSMLANMMFYKDGGETTTEGPKGSIQIAGFSFSIAQVSIGVMSSLVVFPANLIIVQLFRKARAKEIKTDLTKYNDITEEEEDLEKGTEVEETPKKPTKKEGLPYWCAYIAYAVAFLSCATATVFVVFYGITFGPDKSAKWLMSMTISLVQDVLISQPIKIFLLASIFALLIKDPNKAESEPITDANKLGNDEEWMHNNVKDLNEDEKKDFKKMIMDRPPDEAKLEIARQLRFKEKQMKSIIRELVWYMIFLMVILTISYGNRDPDTYRVTKYMNDLFVQSRYSGTKKFAQVHNINDFWKWMNETVIPGVYKHRWYNNKEEYPLGFLADTPTDYLLAVVRMRQLRIQKNSCTFLPIFKHIITECNDFYDTDEEDRAAYLEKWTSPPDVNTTLRPPGAKKTAWEYQTGDELKTFPYWGYKATYNAGGYAKELPSNTKRDIDKAYAIVSEMKSLNWIDRYTRAIFTELAIYNANTNFFCVVTLLYEQLPTGSLFNYPSILTLRLYRYVGGDMYFVMACEITYMLFTLYFIFREIKKVKNDGFDAIKNMWSITEIIVTMLSLSLVVLYFLRIKFTADAVEQMRADSSTFVSFNYTAFLDEWINALMGLIVFLSFVKIIRLLRFNRRMSLLAQTLGVCIPRICAFLIIYGISFFAYSLFACLVFGQQVEGFGTIMRSATTLMDTILGKFALKEMTDANRIIGPLFFYVYTVTMVFILINMFLSIINESFAEVNSDVSKQSNDYEIVDFMVHRLKENIGKTMGNAIMPIYKEPKSKLEKDFDAIQENADNIMHHMRNLTFENMRHTRWFDATASKEKKKKMFEILMEVDWDYFEDELGDSIPVFEDFMAKYDEKKLKSVHESYRYKKLREQENESKMTSDMDSDSDDNSSDSGNSDDNSDAPSNASDDDQTDNEEVALKVPGSPRVTIASPGYSIRGMYSSPNRPKSGVSLGATSSFSNRNTPVPSLNVALPTVSVAGDNEMSQILQDVDRERCATDAQLDSFLPEVQSIDDNNVPKYESDPEQAAKKAKKKKKAKAAKKKKDKDEESETFSIQSKPAWGDPDTTTRKSPAGSSDQARLIPEGEENEDPGKDNEAFQGDETPKLKEKKKKKKKRKQSDI